MTSKRLPSGPGQAPSINQPQVLTRNTIPLMPVWRLWVPLLMQTALILSVPAQAIYTQLTGRTVILQTAPVDPYDLLRGYSVTLGYDISRPETLQHLPGWKQVNDESISAAGSSFYVILEAPTATDGPWKPVGLSHVPTVTPNQVALKGRFTGNQITYGLETYYIPEALREQINQDISQAQQDSQKHAVRVEVKVDTQGRAVPISIWVDNRNYHF